MKSFIWFMTVLLLCLELVHAAHIPTIRGYRQHKRTPTKKSVARSLKRRGNGSCKPSTPSNSTTTPNNGSPNHNNSSSPSNPPNTNTTNTNSGFPSLGFKMPSSVPSSLDGWWSDYKSELGFLGFSYAVDACTFLDTILPIYARGFDPSVTVSRSEP